MSADVRKGYWHGHWKGLDDVDLKVAYAIVFGFYLVVTPIGMLVAKVRGEPMTVENERSIIEQARAAASCSLPFAM